MGTNLGPVRQLVIKQNAKLSVQRKQGNFGTDYLYKSSTRSWWLRRRNSPPNSGRHFCYETLRFPRFPPLSPESTKACCAKTNRGNIRINRGGDMRHCYWIHWELNAVILIQLCNERMKTMKDSNRRHHVECPIGLVARCR